MNHNSTSPTEKKWLKWLLIAIGIEIFGLVVFTLYQTLSKPPQVNATDPVIEPDQGVCYWSGKARAWIDENSNGVRESNEGPLRDVAIYLDLGNGPTTINGSMTDWNGEARLEYPWLDCTDPSLVVYPAIPAGYQLTTPLKVKLDKSIQDQVFEFGFNYLPGAPTVTPRPPEPMCKSYKLGEPNSSELNDLAVSPNGTVWVAGTDIYELPPNSTEWLDARKLNSPPCCSVQSITIENNDSIWFTSGVGALNFNGKSWSSYTIPANQFRNYATRVAIDNRLVWFATLNGVFMLDRDMNLWRSFTTKDGLVSDNVTSVAAAGDGSIWFSTFGGFSQLIWPSRPLGEPEWKTYLYNIDENHHIEARPDGTFWVGGGPGISIFTLASSTWNSFDVPLRGIDFDILNTFAFAKDGSVWIGSGSNNRIYHVLNGSSDNPDLWRSYDSRDGLPAEINQDDKVKAISIAPDGALWIATRVNATRCVFPEH